MLVTNEATQNFALWVNKVLLEEGTVNGAADNVNPELCPLDIRIETAIKFSLLDHELDGTCALFVLM